MQTQVQKPASLTPADPLGARFCQWFSHPWNFIFAPTPTLGEKPQWLTASYRLDLRPLWSKYQDPATLIGLRFGSETRYCLLDIDRGSHYHPANNFSGFKDVLNALEEIGLTRPLVVQSSWSGGMHVYYFFSESLPTFLLARTLKFALIDAGLHLRNGHLEVFPNVKPYVEAKATNYQAHRLPLQDGSFLLDEDLQPLTLDVARFLDMADIAADSQDLAALQRAIAQAQKRPVKGDRQGIPEKDADWERDWRITIEQGWSGPGQTNELLKVMSAYGTVWEQLTGEELIDWVVATAIAAPGYETYCRHQHEIFKRARDWVSCIESNEYYLAYCNRPNRRGTYRQTFGSEAANNIVSLKSDLNEQRSADAQNRIKGAMAHLTALGILPETVVERAKALNKAARELFSVGISKDVLWKQTYKALWHPHSKFKDARLSEERSSSDSTNLAEDGVAASSSADLTASEQQDSRQSPSLLISDCESLATPSSSDQASPNTSSKHSRIAEGRPSSTDSTVSINLSNVIQTETRCDLAKPLPELDLATIPTPPPVIQENSPELESLESLPTLDSTKNSYTPPLMKVSLPVSGTTPAGLCPAPHLEDRGEREGGNEPVAVPGPSASPELRRLARLRPEANSHAQRTVGQQALAAKRFFSKEERDHRVAVAKFRFYWESGEPALMSEATQWAQANPDALPEALPQSDVRSQLHVAPTQTAQSNGELPVSEGELPEALSLCVGDLVAHADPYQVAYSYHGIIEQLTQDGAVVRWAERAGKPLERETYDLCELRRIEEVSETSL